MLYCEWADTFGKNRWYKSDGNARTIYPLDYDWQKIYDDCAKQADWYFKDRVLPCDEIEFTTQFLAMVPTAWLKYKTQLEFFSGNLAGTTIDPKEFHAGRFHTYRRDMTDELDQTLGSRQDTQSGSDSMQAGGENKSRVVTYEQGVQAVEPGNGNIGELGRDYASALEDTVAQPGQTENRQNQNTVTQGEQANKEARKIHEEIEEDNEVVNYYDQLAFGRERMDKLNNFVPFYQYFEELFLAVDSFTPWYKCEHACTWPRPWYGIV